MTDDAISRETVVKILAEFEIYHGFPMSPIIDKINMLPSVQPSRKVIEDIKAEINE